MNGIRVAICGKKNSGKNTLANTIRDLTDHYCHLIAMADPIKEIGETMFPWANPEGWWGSSNQRDQIILNTTDNDGNPLTYRQVLIDIGSQARRYNPLHWVNVFDYRFNKFVNPQDGCIVPDVRYINEYDYLRTNGFYLIKLNRNTINQSSDPTETNQDAIKPEEFDAIIDNNGTLKDLQTKVKALKDQIIAHQK